MNGAGRLSLYGAGLAVAVAVGYAVAAMPDNTVASVPEQPQVSEHGAHASMSGGSAAGLSGLSLSQDGYLLGEVSAPAAADVDGELRFQIRNADGKPVTAFVESHEKDLHLIVVRSDGSGFQHVHPSLNAATGTWSAPWKWPAAGSYRVFADFQPADAADAPALTLARTVEVAGSFSPVDASTPRTTDQVAGYTVTLGGDLMVGSAREVTATVSRNGSPVTTLQPYLGAFGHLVALRDGDLAYLHVHPEGDEPKPGQDGGPTVSFVAEAPTAGRYLLYLDFQVDDAVHTATFVLDAQQPAGSTPEIRHDQGGGH